MSEVSSEGGNIQNVCPRELDEIPSPDSGSGERYITSFDSQELESQTKYEHYKGVQQYYKHKGQWSRFLLWAIGCLIGYQMVLLVLVGFRVLNFKDYDWLLPALLVQNLAQIVGLASYAVKHLFSDITLKNGGRPNG